MTTDPNGSASALPGQLSEQPITGIRRGTADFHRVSAALFLAGFAMFSLLYCAQPLFPVFAQQFAVSPAASSLTLSLSTGFLAFAIIGAAVVAETVGRRGIMFVSMTGAALLNIAAAHAPSWHALLICRALEGIVLGGVPAVAMAYLAEEIDRRSLGFSMGIYVAGTALGGMAGRLGAGILADHFSWRGALEVIGVTGVLASVGFFVLLPASRNFTRHAGFDPRYHVRAWSSHLGHSALPLLFAVGFLAMGSFVTIYNYVGFRLMAPPFALSQTTIGFIFTAYVFGILASSVAGAMADRIGRARVLISGFAISLLGTVLTAASSLPSVIVGIVILTIGFFVTHSVASGWVGRLAVTAKGHASSLYLLAYYIGSSIAGTSGGWFWSWGGWPCVVAFTGTMLLIGLGIGARLAALVRDQPVA